MKELETIVAEAARALAAGKSAALATVVAIEGSAYRLPGARMLIVDGRWVAGSISGGCLEDDVVLRAGEATERDEALLTTYDTTSDDDIVFGVGLGCKGVITLLIEPLRVHDGAVDFIAFAEECLRSGTGGVSATVIRTRGLPGSRTGSRLVSREGPATSDIATSDISNGGLVEKVRQAVADFHEGPRMVSITLDDGSAEVFVERIEPPIPLVVFGAGHDALPVVQLAKALGWHVTVVDHRPAYAQETRFPQADRIVVCAPREVTAQIALTPETLALVMTHNYLRDRDLLEILLPSAARYLGLLGPRQRTDRLLADLADQGVRPSDGKLARLYAPVGLDIGSEGPAEVALSILSEMQAVITRHRGGHLRERKRPIHQAAGVAQA